LSQPRENPQEWYLRPLAIAGAIFCFGPLGLLLLWFRPGTRLYIKVLISVAVIAVTVWATVGAVECYRGVLLYYRELAGVTGAGS